MIPRSASRFGFQRCQLLRVLVVGVLTFAVSLATAGLARANETVTSCGLSPNEVFGHAAVFGINTYEYCGNSTPYLAIETRGNTVAAGQRATWQATAPPGLLIDTATVPSTSPDYVNDGHQYGGGFYWQGGGQPFYGANGNEGQLILGVANNTPGFPSPYFGFQLVCGAKPCTTGLPSVSVTQVILDVAETTAPTLLAGKLWAQRGWVRGDWQLLVNGDSPSGVCWLSAAVDGQLVGSQSFPADGSTWHQCNAAGSGGLNTTVHTVQFANGSHQLTVSGSDAAGVSSGRAATTNIDNVAPSVGLSGPTDAPSTAGTQYITATASAGPSGISRIVCSVDGVPAQTFNSASGQVPVSGIGQHTVSCNAFNNAVDATGNVAESPTGTWSIKIGEPTVMGLAFFKLVGLRCHRARVRVTVPGRVITVRRHGKPVRVKTRPRIRAERVVRCHPRTVRRRTVVFVRVRRHGHLIKVKRVKTVRVVVAPHAVGRTSRRVAFGHTTTVSGYLGTAAGIALGGRRVELLTAPQNGTGNFTAVETVATAADGTWTAPVPAGPSRLVEAAYAGDTSTEGMSSNQVSVNVPARVKLISVSPRLVRWGGTVHITGRLLGGYLPAGGALLRLRIGAGRNYQTYGVQEHVTGNGRFKAIYTFGLGDASILRHYFFEVATLPMGSYPYSPATSNRRYVLVGGHPPLPHHHHRKRRRR